jgi:hypothetical protein
MRENVPMKRSKKLANNKKGVSSIFIAIYLCLIGIILISALFAGQVISHSSITDYLKIEQERTQEYFTITKLLTDPTDLNFTQIQIENSGAITVRIRAVYVDGEFKFDPSLYGNSYIGPKEKLNITLNPPVPIDDDALNVDWVVTSERGTRASELGMNLWDVTSGPIYTPNKFYFGPLMLVFDMFHWKSEDGPWNSGWSIPSKTKDVTWRILLTNVDNRTITLTEDSDLSLVGNTGQQNWVLNWYIDPEITNMSLQPGRFYSIYYKWSSPYSSSDDRITDISFNPDTPCLNFLTFTGSIKEFDGTTSSFGQTIPFEAVLVTD